MSALEDRRRARQNWPIRKMSLRDEPLTDALDTSTVDERIALVWELTRQQRAFAGLEAAPYVRSEMPGRLVRRR